MPSTHGIVIGIQGVDEGLEVTGADDLVLHVRAVAHDGEDARAEDLQAVVRTVAPPHAGRAALSRPDDALVHGDAVVQHRHNLARVHGH